MGSAEAGGHLRVEIPDDRYWRRQIKCQDACPVGTDARGYVRAIAAGDLETAYLIARGPNPLASICGRVCGAPCEAACRRSSIDDGVSIRALKRFVTERFGVESCAKGSLEPLELLNRVLDHSRRRECRDTEELAALPGASGTHATLEELLAKVKESQSGSRDDAPKVAIIGSGPAGLAAAHDLALLGVRPTVFEMEPVPAGMLAVGIPEYRLPRDLIRAEVEVIRSMGVEFVCNTQVGKDISLDEIRKLHRATIVAVGAKRSRTLPIPGGQSAGVLGGVEFLRDVALRDESVDSTSSQLGGRVVVIGGGNVAYDISRSVIRQTEYDVSRSALRMAHVGEVHLCCLESLDEMPADDVEILEGHEEGVRLHPSLGPVEILRTEAGAVRGVTFKRCLRVFDEHKRFAPIFDEDDLVTIEADTVIWAIGQQVDLSFIDADSDISLTQRGGIENNPETLETTAPDVFTAGDVAYGARLLIDAIASGKRCARSVYSYLQGQSLSAGHEYVQVNIPDYERERDYEKVRRLPIAALEVQRRIEGQHRIVERGYDSREATAEAGRCLDCGVNTIFDSEKCILCGGCADVCPELCLELVSCDRIEADEKLRELTSVRYGDIDLSTVSAIIKDEEKCIRCALCAQRCPVGAITMERFGFTARWAIDVG